jgi:hypothetical protein
LKQVVVVPCVGSKHLSVALEQLHLAVDREHLFVHRKVSISFVGSLGEADPHLLGFFFPGVKRLQRCGQELRELYGL